MSSQLYNCKIKFQLLHVMMHNVTRKAVFSLFSYQEMCIYFKKNLPLGQRELNELLLPHVDKLIKRAKKDGKLYYAASMLDVKAYFYMQTGRGGDGALELAKEAKETVETIVGLDNLQDGVLNIEALCKVSSDSPTLSNSPSLALLYASILYNYGRTYFYTKDSAFKDESKKMLSHAQTLIESLLVDGHKYLLGILIERSGILYHLLEGSVKEVEEALSRYEKLLAVEGKYIDEREGEVNLTDDEFHKKQCYRQLIRTARVLSERNLEADKEKYYRQALDYTERLIKLVENDKEERGRIASYYNEIGFLLINKDNPLRDLSKARSYFTIACVIEESGNEGRGWFDYPLAAAHKGLTLISLERRDVDAARGHSARYLEICLHIHHNDKANKRVQEAMDLIKEVATSVIKTSWRDYVSKSKEIGVGKVAGIWS